MALVPDAVIPSLAECEEVIERGLHSFVEVGQALMTIRDNGLYSRSHSTFEDYCQDRWGFTRIRAHQLISSSEVAGVLTTVNTAPARERHARELVPLKNDPEQLAEAWSEVIEVSEGKPTAKIVKEVVAKYVTAAKKKQRDKNRPSLPDRETDRQVAEMQAELHGLYLALERIGRMHLTVGQVVEVNLGSGQDLRIGDFIDDAIEWLTALREAWNEQRHDPQTVDGPRDVPSDQGEV